MVFQTELYQLPTPMFEIIEKNTKATLFGHRSFNEMEKKKYQQIGFVQHLGARLS